jgi:hypothetical protein
MKDSRAMERLLAQLNSSSDLMALANAGARIASMALNEHPRREGDDKHAAAHLEIANYLEGRTALLQSVWMQIDRREQSGS